MGQVMKILVGKDTDILGGGKVRPVLGSRCAAHFLTNGKVLLQQDLPDKVCRYKEECCSR